MVATTDVLLFANNVSALLNNDVAPGDGSIVLASGQGAQFPSPVAGQFFVLTVQNLQSGALEICYCTARSGDLLTVERAQEGTSAGTWLAAQSIVQLRLTKGMLEKLLQVRFTGADVDKYLRVQADGEVLAEDALFQVPPGISYLDANETHTAGKATAPIIINANSPGTVTLDMAESNAFTVNVGAAIALSLTNAQDGQTLNLLIKQGATGYAVTFTAGQWTWPGGTVPTITTDANAVDMISGRYDLASTRMRAVAIQAFA